MTYPTDYADPHEAYPIDLDPSDFLKPCQCGSDVELCRGDDDYYIYCPKCKLKTFSDRVYDNITDNCDRLIEVWNRRAKDGKSE